MSGIQHSRILRFCLILITAIITIFIYATYSLYDISLPTPFMRTGANYNHHQQEQQFPLSTNGTPHTKWHHNKSVSSTNSLVQPVRPQGKSMPIHIPLKSMEVINKINERLNGSDTSPPIHKKPKTDVKPEMNKIKSREKGAKPPPVHSKMISWLKDQWTQGQQLTSSQQTQENRSNCTINSKNCFDDSSPHNSTRNHSKSKDTANVINEVKNGIDAVTSIGTGNDNILNMANNNFSGNDENFIVNNNELNRISDNEVLIPVLNVQNVFQGYDSASNVLLAASPSSTAKDELKGKIVKIISELNKTNTKIEMMNKVVDVNLAQKLEVKVNTPPPPPRIPRLQDLYVGGHLVDTAQTKRLCPEQGEELKLLILVISAPSHLNSRLAIRQTWGHFSVRRDVSMAFLLGQNANATLMHALRQENFVYGDLIVGNFIDSYNNLTLKTISGLEWIDKYCPKVKFILKTDDDMFINIPRLLLFLDSHKKYKRSIYGRLANKWTPIRSKKSKYYVSKEQFGAPVFPSFTTGPAYVLTSDIVHDLYKAALKQVYLKLEDVFTTGILAQYLSIRRVHVNEFLNRRIAFNPCNIRKVISIHMIKPNEQFDLWKKLLDQSTKCK